MQNPVMFYNVKNQPLGWLIHWFSKLSSFCNRGICSLYVFTVSCTTEAWPLRLRHLGILINTRSWIQVINRRLRCFKKYILRLVFSISFFFFLQLVHLTVFCEGKEKPKDIFRHLTSYFAILTQMSPQTFKILIVI